MASRTVGSKSCNSRSDMEFRGKGNFFSRGLSFSRSFSRRLQSTSVLTNIQQWTASPSSWSMRSPPPVISSPVINACNNFSSPPGPTVSQMWYDLSVSSSNLKACNSPKVSVATTHLKPPPSPGPSGKQRYLFKRVGTTPSSSSRPKNVSNNTTAVDNESGVENASNGDESTSNSSTTTSDEKSDAAEEKLESSEYLTVFVGERSSKRVKYVISKHFLRHHLFQVLLKCSKDEVGIENEERGGVPIVCDPALFVQLVTVVGATLFAEIPADAK